MNTFEQQPVRLSEPYQRTIGRTTFQVSSFANAKGTETAQQMLVRLMEKQTMQDEMTKERKTA